MSLFTKQMSGHGRVVHKQDDRKETRLIVSLWEGGRDTGRKAILHTRRKDARLVVPGDLVRFEYTRSRLPGLASTDDFRVEKIEVV
jgi:hypothetical protein